MIGARVRHLARRAEQHLLTVSLLAGNRHPRVIDLPDQGYWENPTDLAGSNTEIARARAQFFAQANAVAVLAHYHPQAKLSRSFLTYVRALRAHGYRVVVVSTAPGSAPLEWPADLRSTVISWRRPNVGYDFGSWATALEQFPEIAQVNTVLFSNDSLVGPFAPLTELLERVDDYPADIIAAVSSYQIRAHLQSFQLWFKNGVLNEPVIRKFFRNVRIQPSKMAVVRHYELGFSLLLRHQPLSWQALYTPEMLGAGGANPTIVSWQQLLKQGYPFVKRTIVTDPSLAPRGHQIADVVQQLYGENLEDWL